VLAIFNREETLYGVVLLQLLVRVFLCSLHFPPLCSHFCNGARLDFPPSENQAKTIFFHKANFSVENKDKEKRKQKG
jgi:hypothetical protein